MRDDHHRNWICDGPIEDEEVYGDGDRADLGIAICIASAVVVMGFVAWLIWG
jgi:hypothetical protein